jgi:hypothetical protein
MARSPQFLNQLSQHSIPHTPEGSSILLFQVLRIFHGLRPEQPGSAPSWPAMRVHSDDAAGFTLCYGLLGCDDTASTLRSLLAPDGHYEAAWPLPRPDFHRLVD